MAQPSLLQIEYRVHSFIGEHDLKSTAEAIANSAVAILEQCSSPEQRGQAAAEGENQLFFVGKFMKENVG
jgi:hypothetical protein